MPVDFNNTEDIRRISRPIDYPKEWGTRVRNIVRNALDSFGDASQRDIGTNGGQIPLVENISEVMPEATATRRGGVTLSVVPTISQLRGVSNSIRDAIRAFNIRIRQILIRDFESPGLLRFSLSEDPSIVLISSASQSADGSRNEGMAEHVILLSDTRNTTDTSRIYLNNGQAQIRRNPAGVGLVNLLPLDSNRARGNDTETNGIYFIDRDTLDAFGFKWAVVLPEGGTQGGGQRVPQADTQPEINNRMRTAGVAGDLLIAYKPGASLFYTTTTTTAEGRYTNPLYFAFRNLAGPVASKDAFVAEIPL